MSVERYVHENVPRQITTGLRLRGIDILTVQEDSRAGISDPEVLDRATELKRILFSRDDDLLAIANQRQQQGQFFYGVIYSHPQRSSIGDCIRALELIATVCEPRGLYKSGAVSANVVFRGDRTWLSVV